MSHQVVVRTVDLYYAAKNWPDLDLSGYPPMATNFFAKFPNYGVKYKYFGAPAYSTTEYAIQEAFDEVTSNPPFLSPRGTDMVDTLLDSTVDVVWVWDGLAQYNNRQQLALTFLTELEGALVQNLSKLASSSYKPKAILGYSGGCVAMLALEALGLCGAIHGPLMEQLRHGDSIINQDIANHIDACLKPFKQQSGGIFPFSFSGITAENDLAKRVMNGQQTITGTVWGGMLEIATVFLQYGNDYFALENCILFIETPSGASVVAPYLTKLLASLQNGKNSIKAVIIGQDAQTSGAWNTYKQQIIDSANSHGIALFLGLHTGHESLNYSVPFGPAVLSGNGDQLVFSYDVDKYQQLLAARRQKYANMVGIQQNFALWKNKLAQTPLPVHTTPVIVNWIDVEVPASHSASNQLNFQISVDTPVKQKIIISSQQTGYSQEFEGIGHHTIANFKIPRAKEATWRIQLASSVKVERVDSTTSLRLGIVTILGWDRNSTSPNSVVHLQWSNIETPFA